MPLPPPILPLFLLHPTPASTCVARAGASSLLAAALARDLWRRTPEWIRDDDLWKSLLQEEGEGAAGGGHRDEMASLAAVIQKLQGLIVTGYEKLGSERRRVRRRKTAWSMKSSQNRVLRKSTSECLCQMNRTLCHICKSCREDEEQSITDSSMAADSASVDPITPLEWHAALLAYIQLSNQMRERYPFLRDRMYDASLCESGESIQHICNQENESQQHKQNMNTNNGSTVTSDAAPNNDSKSSLNNQITLAEIKELKAMLDYAVWAYEPDQEVLRKLLRDNIHTSNCDPDSSNTGDSNQDSYQLLVHRTTSYIEPSSESNDANKKSVNQSTKKQSPPKKLRKPPGRVGYYVAVSHSKKILLIGMKGTSTLEELLTDCCGRAVRLDLDHDPHHPVVDDVMENTDGCNYLLEDNCKLRSRTQTNTYEHDCSDVRLKVSLISGDRVLSQTEEIEVELLYQVDSIPTSLSLSHELGSPEANAIYLAHSLSSAPGEHERSMKKSPMTNSSTPSAPTLLENILLVPSVLDDEVTKGELVEKKTSTQMNVAHESNGIEMQPERSTKVRGAHEGILHCAQQLFSEISPLIEEFAITKGYDVVCTGHSLGAGTSSLLALLIRGKYPDLVVPREHSNYSESTEGAQVPTERVRAYAFASPPILDRNSSLACRHYITSIINNSDIIPRSSLTNLDVLLTMLEAVRNRLVGLGMNPDGNNKTTSKKGSKSDLCQKPKNIIASMTALFRKLSEGTDGDLLLDPSELQQVWDEAVKDASLGDDGIYWDEEGDHHLFVPGNLLMMYKPWSMPEGTIDSELESCGAKVNTSCEDNGKQHINPDESEISYVYRTLWTDGTAPMLKGFEVGAGGNIVTDHLTSSYYRALESLEQTLG